MAEATAQTNGAAIAYVVVALGTNDTKVDFANRQAEVAPNLERLILDIKNSPLPALKNARIVLLWPPKQDFRKPTPRNMRGPQCGCRPFKYS
ncbi:MAG: hypothetical protein EAZ91_25355 [Cytophagales bacterium]|nr:MAG: hypothetical protein EAZ91_25355 [Cytophagales bacterium]